MKKAIGWGVVVLAVATAASGQRNLREDTSAPASLVTLPDASRWQAGLVYSRVSRQVELDGAEWKLRADVADVFLGFAPVPWLLLYAQGGASEGRLDKAMAEKASAGAGGLLGASLNLWQVHEGAQATAWRFTVQAAGQYAVRRTRDEGSGEIEWSEALVMLPLDYHLTFARTFRNFYMAEFHSLHAYAGPAYSRIDGTWTRGASERDFEGSQDVGVVGGADLWLLENLSFGARVEWFDETSMHVSVRYRF